MPIYPVLYKYKAKNCHFKTSLGLSQVCLKQNKERVDGGGLRSGRQQVGSRTQDRSRSNEQYFPHSIHHTEGSHALHYLFCNKKHLHRQKALEDAQYERSLPHSPRPSSPTLTITTSFWCPSGGNLHKRTGVCILFYCTHPNGSELYTPGQLSLANLSTHSIPCKVNHLILFTSLPYSFLYGHIHNLFPTREASGLFPIFCP